MAPTPSDLHCLQRSDQEMIRWMYGVTTKDQVSFQELLEWMQLDNPEKVLHTRRLRWPVPVERSDGGLTKFNKLNPGGRGHCHLTKTY